MNKEKRAAYFVILISVIVTTVLVFIPLLVRGNEGKIIILCLTISPYLLLVIMNRIATKKGAIRCVWILSCVNCMIGAIAYITFYPSSPTSTGGGASMAALIFFFVTFFQLLLVTVSSLATNYCIKGW